jgi:hypothetical protein
MRSLIVVGVVCSLGVGIAACGSSSSTGSSSSQGSSSSRALTLEQTSGPNVAVFAHVSGQSAGDTACTSQQSQLGQQVKQIEAKLPTGMAVTATSGGNTVLIALEYGSTPFPASYLDAFLDVWAETTRTSVYVNQPDTGDEYNHASVVICAVTVPH